MRPGNTAQYYDRLDNISDDAVFSALQTHQFNCSARLKNAAHARKKVSESIRRMESESYLPPQAQDLESAKLAESKTDQDGAGAQPSAADRQQHELESAADNSALDLPSSIQPQSAISDVEAKYVSLQPKLVRRPYNYKRRPGSFVSNRPYSMNSAHDADVRVQKSHSARRKKVGSTYSKDRKDPGPSATTTGSSQWYPSVLMNSQEFSSYNSPLLMESNPGVYQHPNITYAAHGLPANPGPFMFGRQGEPSYNQEEYLSYGYGFPGPEYAYGDYSWPPVPNYEYSTTRLSSEVTPFNGMQMMYSNHSRGPSTHFADSFVGQSPSAASNYSQCSHPYSFPDPRFARQSPIAHEPWGGDRPKKLQSNMLTPTSLCGSPTADAEHKLRQATSISQDGYSGARAETLKAAQTDAEPVQSEYHNQLSSTQVTKGTKSPEHPIAKPTMTRKAGGSGRDSLVVERSNTEPLTFDFGAYGLSDQQAESFKGIFDRQLEMLYRAVARQFNEEHKPTQIGIELVLSYLQKFEIKQ